MISYNNERVLPHSPAPCPDQYSECPNKTTCMGPLWKEVHEHLSLPMPPEHLGEKRRFVHFGEKKSNLRNTIS